MAGSTRNWPLIEPYLGIDDDEDLKCEPWHENPVMGELLRVFGRGNSRNHRATPANSRLLTQVYRKLTGTPASRGRVGGVRQIVGTPNAWLCNP